MRAFYELKKEERETLSERAARQRWSGRAREVWSAALSHTPPASRPDVLLQQADVEDAMREAFYASVARGTPGDEAVFGDAVARVHARWMPPRPAPEPANAGTMPMPLFQSTRHDITKRTHFR